MINSLHYVTEGIMVLFTERDYTEIEALGENIMSSILDILYL